MPTYTYECQRCRRTYDIQQRMTDAHITECQVCGSSKFKRIISAPFISTGSKTDSGSTRVPEESGAPANGCVAAFGGGCLNCAMDPNARHPSLGVRFAKPL